MTQTLNYRQMGTSDRSQAHTLFAQTMGYVAATAALFSAGAWLGRDLTGGVGIAAFIAAFAAPRLSNGTRGHCDLPVMPVDLLQQSLHPLAATLDREESAGVEGDRAGHWTPSARRAHA